MSCTSQAKTGTLTAWYRTTFTPGAVTYAAKDAFQAIQTIPGATKTESDSGKITAIKIIDYIASGSLTKPVINFDFATDSFGVADNAAYDFNGDADTVINEEAVNCGGVYVDKESTAVYSTSGTDLDISFKNQNNTDIYFQMYIVAGATFKSGETITIEIKVELD